MVLDPHFVQGRSRMDRWQMPGQASESAIPLPGSIKQHGRSLWFSLTGHSLMAWGQRRKYLPRYALVHEEDGFEFLIDTQRLQTVSHVVVRRGRRVGSSGACHVSSADRG